jgi:hypothetical protein
MCAAHHIKLATAGLTCDPFKQSRHFQMDLEALRPFMRTVINRQQPGTTKPGSDEESLMGKTRSRVLSSWSQGLRDGVLWLGSLRDGLLVCGGGLYLLGYIAWSVNAWSNNMGLLPALEFQYVVAGVIVAALSTTIYGMIKALLLVRARLPSWLNPQKTWGRLARAAILVVFLLSFFVGAAADRLGATNITDGALLVLTFTGPLLLPLPVTGTGWLSALSKFLGSTTGFLFEKVFGPTYVVLVSLIGSVLLGRTAIMLYVNLPQALGGVRPRCAFVDFDENKLSKDTRSILMQSNTPSSAEHVLRSVQLDVLFSSSDFMIVRAHGSNNNPETYQIKTDSLDSIVWCD